MKVLITGAKGQLGSDLVNILSTINGYEVIGFGRDSLDITDLVNVQQIFRSVMPDLVIHSAAYTKVDQAEAEPDAAFLVNAIGTRNVAKVSEEVNAKLVYISTDYVFNGTASSPINEFEPTSPLGVYGKSKLAGEQFVRDFHSKYFIVRTSWVYGRNGGNFVKTMLRLAVEKDNLSVVNDQVGSPTYTVDLVKKIKEISETELYGIYHVSNSGICSWYDFADAIFTESGYNVNLRPCATKEFPTLAPRPSYSAFDHMALRLNGFDEMREWKVALKEFLNHE